MTNVLMYDFDVKEIEEVADVNDLSVAQVISYLLDYLPDMMDNYHLK